MPVGNAQTRNFNKLGPDLLDLVKQTRVLEIRTLGSSSDKQFTEKYPLSKMSWVRVDVTSARGPEASPGWVPLELRCPQRPLMPFIDRGFGYCCNLPQQNLRLYTSLAVLALNLLPVRRRAIQLLDITGSPPDKLSWCRTVEA
jgi:hypothetical protein